MKRRNKEEQGFPASQLDGGWGVGGADGEGDSHGPSRKLLQRLPEAASVSDLRLTRGPFPAVVSEGPVLLLTPGFYGRERVGILAPLQGGGGDRWTGGGPGGAPSVRKDFCVSKKASLLLKKRLLQTFCFTFSPSGSLSAPSLSFPLVPSRFLSFPPCVFTEAVISRLSVHGCCGFQSTF